MTTKNTENSEKPQPAVASSELLCDLEMALDYATLAADRFRKSHSPHWYAMLPILESLRDIAAEYRRQSHNDKLRDAAQ